MFHTHFSYLLPEHIALSIFPTILIEYTLYLRIVQVLTKIYHYIPLKKTRTDVVLYILFLFNALFIILGIIVLPRVLLLLNIDEDLIRRYNIRILTKPLVNY